LVALKVPVVDVHDLVYLVDVECIVLDGVGQSLVAVEAAGALLVACVDPSVAEESLTIRTFSLGDAFFGQCHAMFEAWGADRELDIVSTVSSSEPLSIPCLIFA